MDKKYEAIGVLDSGLGGLSVLREAIKIMPNENFIFFTLKFKLLWLFDEKNLLCL